MIDNYYFCQSRQVIRFEIKLNMISLPKKEKNKKERNPIFVKRILKIAAKDKTIIFKNKEDFLCKIQKNS